MKEQIMKEKSYPFAFMHEVYEEIMAEAKQVSPEVSGRNMERTVGLNRHVFSKMKKGVSSMC